jgi:hypothetical protein
MKYLVLGQGKSGTTAIARALELGAGLPVQVFFEPRSLASVTATASSSSIVVKMLIDHWAAGDQTHIDWFDRRVFIARDPRDVVISRLLYRVYDMQFIHDPQKFEEFLAALRAKEQSPSEHTVKSLFDLLAKLESSRSELTHLIHVHKKAVNIWRTVMDAAHLLRYEDFVDDRTEVLSAYVGFHVDSQVDVDPNWRRVSRTKSHGNWKHWFTPVDDDLARTTFADYLNTFGYDDWEKPPIQSIDPEQSSKYVERVVAEALRRKPMRRQKGHSTRGT